MNRKILKNFPMKSCLQSKKDHGLPIWRTTKQQSSFPKIILGNNARSSSVKLIILFGMSHTYSKLEQTISCEEVLIMKRQRRYCGNVTTLPMEVTSMGREPPQKCFNPVSIDRHFSKMPIHIASIVMNVKEPGECQSGMKCLYNAFLKLKCLIVGV